VFAMMSSYHCVSWLAALLGPAPAAWSASNENKLSGRHCERAWLRLKLF
jgi:hypothetical protein